ncbi:hypothetical protein CAPTEDRAFT_168266 [Capitella teleta]|uniref:Uncharacterized protein n=1 Tax=Capitella teleta TaxID=283909 RepID=R7U6X9_CAPTE|nr:hypothetical protein CAPTEDRAFT_168266 [Capitella teleta]|eukprot:ELT99416.1 hypothetical protein CAPTEDRAFT_168266 [Capitella teleta]
MTHFSESIFNGKYGSELEYQLECQVDMLVDRKQRISVAKYKWQNSRVLLQHAVNQLAFSVKRWGELDRVRSDNMQVRYTMATETRNNVIAASQNITSAHRYLQTIEFPYCKQPEMETLNRAVNNIYSDMQTSERHKHAMHCYSTTHKRAAALLQWFDHVINTTIKKDYDKAADDVDVKSRELRAERVQLIRARIDDNTSNVGVEIDAEVIKKTDQPQMETHATEADQVSTAGDLELLGEEGAPVEGEELSDPTPLALNELAPLPDDNALFGDIDELKKQHEQEMQDFKKTQDVNKARMEQGLQEKLRARRSRQVRADQAQTEE